MLESGSILNTAPLGPAPADQARPSATRDTRPRERTSPQQNERRKAPTAEGARSRWPTTTPVHPARTPSAPPLQPPPATPARPSATPPPPRLGRRGASP